MPAGYIVACMKGEDLDLTDKKFTICEQNSGYDVVFRISENVLFPFLSENICYIGKCAFAI